MKILWCVNIIFPYPADKLGIDKPVMGGWLLSLMESIKNSDDIKKLGIATVYNGKYFKKFEDEKVIYYLIPKKNIKKYSKKSENFWKLILKDFCPNLIHIHGTEYPHSLELLSVSENIKNYVSIQGLISVCGQKEIYNAGLTYKDFLENITIRDILKNDLLLIQSHKFLKNSKIEKKVLQKCSCIIGRTNWDYANTYYLTNQNKYEFCNECLRTSFYKYSWNLKNVKRHSIFVSQASYPLKGFHQLLKATVLLKRNFSDLKIYVAGSDITKSKGNFKEKLKMTGYGKYIKKMITKYDLYSNIEFLGLVSEEEYCQKLLQCNVFVQSSSIENSSNALGEAMLLGMPVVASYVGGTPDILLDKQEGLLYPFGDYNLMAKYISDIFNNDDLAKSLGNNAKIRAKKTHDISINTNRIIEIYKKGLKL